MVGAIGSLGALLGSLAGLFRVGVALVRRVCLRLLAGSLALFATGSLALHAGGTRHPWWLGSLASVGNRAGLVDLAQALGNRARWSGLGLVRVD